MTARPPRAPPPTYAVAPSVGPEATAARGEQVGRRNPRPAMGAHGLSPEGHCDFLMSDDLPHETENTVYRYLIAISKLRLGILTEQGEGS